MAAGPKKSLYELLGVTARATPEEIASAYEASLAANAASRTNDSAVQMALKEAHAVLSNPQRRAAYDASLRNRATAHARQAARKEEASRFPMAPIVVGLLLLMVAGGWWFSKKPKAVQPQVQQISLTPGERQQPVRQQVVAGGAAVGPELSSEQLYAQVAPSIVRVNVLRRDGTPLGLGSGVVIDTDTVITNCHVALRGDVVQIREAQESLNASVIVADEELDLCKLRVNGLSKRSAVISTSALNVGQKVFALGSPRGLDLTLSDGLVSSLREGPSGTYIQTTAPVSPGSSGGGLFDARGRLVGIITFGVMGGQNLNFAVPVEWFDKMTTRRREDDRGLAQEGSGRGQEGSADARRLLGAWQCYGPLTGRGFNVVFEERGTYSGSFDGKPIGGYYTLSRRNLMLGGQGENSNFVVEELSEQRLVMSRGEGRRLACNR